MESALSALRTATAVLCAGLLLTACTAPAGRWVAPGPPIAHSPTAPTVVPSASATSPARSPSAVVSPAATLRVRGNRIVDGAGQVVRLRGFNHSGTEYACVEGWGIFDAPGATSMSPSVVTAMATWAGANVVRVPLNEQCWLGLGVPAAYGGPAYRRAVVEFVNLLHRNGFVAVLDLHRSAPGDAASLEQEQMPDREHSVTFWREVATAFRSYPSVVFDLFNEPAPYGESDTVRAWQCWRDGGCLLTAKNGGGHYVAAGMAELLHAVRDAGAPNLVLAGGIHWSEMLNRWLEYRPADPLGNLAAAFHDYSFNTDCAGPRCYDGDLARVAAQVPLFVGEIGPELDLGPAAAGTSCPSSAIRDTGFARTIFDWLDAHGASYTAWSWNAWPSCWSLVTDWSGAPTPVWGRLVRQRLAGSGHR
jgi:endoglucanase